MEKEIGVVVTSKQTCWCINGRHSSLRLYNTEDDEDLICRLGLAMMNAFVSNFINH